MRAPVERNDFGLVDHFITDSNVARSLNDLRSVVVDHRQDGSHHAAGDTAIVQTLVLPRFVGTAALLGLLGLRSSLFGLLRQRGESPIWWVDEERRNVL